MRDRWKAVRGVKGKKSRRETSKMILYTYMSSVEWFVIKYTKMYIVELCSSVCCNDLIRYGLDYVTGLPFRYCLSKTLQSKSLSLLWLMK